MAGYESLAIDGRHVELEISTERAWRLLTNNLHTGMHGEVRTSGDPAIIETLERTRAIIGKGEVTGRHLDLAGKHLGQHLVDTSGDFPPQPAVTAGRALLHRHIEYHRDAVVPLGELGSLNRPAVPPVASFTARQGLLRYPSVHTASSGWYTASARGLAAEVEVDHVAVGLDRQSVINCDGLRTIAQTTLTTRVGEVDATTLERVCSAVSFALGC